MTTGTDTDTHPAHPRPVPSGHHARQGDGRGTPDSTPDPVGIDLDIATLASRCHARVLGASDGVVIRRIGPLEGADAHTLTFVRDHSFLDRWRESSAAAALVGRAAFANPTDPAPPTRDPGAPQLDSRSEGARAEGSWTDTIHPALAEASRGRPVLIVNDTDLALVALLPLFTTLAETDDAGAHPSAVVDPAATVDPTACIGPGCVVMAGARVGAGARLVANVTVGRNARVGTDSVLCAGVVICDGCTVGDRCLLHPNASIGADGFNFRPDPSGRGIVKIPHIGFVRVGNDVEIGASSAIDRGKFVDTVIGDGTKIDNLVQIGHNATIGRCCLICGLVGLSGSVTLGDGVILAGGVGIADNVSIGAGARVGAGAGVMNDVPAGETWIGVPAQPAREAMANYGAWRTLARDLRDLRKQAKALETRLASAKHQ